MSQPDPFGQPGGASARAPQVKNGRYRLLGPETNKVETWSRVTTFAKSISDMTGLSKWENRMIVKGMGMRADLTALAMATPLEDKDTLQGIAHRAKEMAGGNEGANRGSAMHSLTETVDRGGSISDAPAVWQADVEAYRRALDAEKLVVEPSFIERFVAIPEFQVCGKLDRIYWWGAGSQHVIGDVKTAKNIDYGWGDIAVQLALYAAATHYWDDAKDDWVEMPSTLSRDLAVMAHIPIGVSKTDIYGVNIAAGLEAARLCQQVRAWRSRRDLAWPLVAPMSAVVAASSSDPYAARLVRATCSADMTAVWRDASAAGAWTPELEALGKRVLAGLR
jgi:hypothetical protein